MAKIDSKKALLGVGVLGVAGLAGAAFAASITTPPTNAGQGDDVTEGFTVTNVEYDGGAAGTVTDVTVNEVEFDIARDTQALVVADANASVFVQLRAGAVNSEWEECSVSNGHAVCTLDSGSDILIEDISAYSVVAYDDLDS